MKEELMRVSSVRELFFKYGQDGPLGTYDFDFDALGPPPHTAEVRTLCDRYLCATWTQTLTDQEAAFIEVWPDVPDKEILRSMNYKMAKQLFVFAEKLGKPFVDYCLVYQRLIYDWRKDPDGLRHYEEYCKALMRGVEIEQAPPYEGPKGILQEGAPQFREQAIKEWGLLRERIKAFRTENPRAAFEELVDFIKGEVLGAEIGRYRVLKCRLSHLKQFLSYHESENNLDKALLWRADGFVKQWMSYGHGREAVSLGHDIGKMGKALKAKV